MKHLLKHHIKYIWIGVAVILMLGGLAEYRWGDKHFQRSGSVLVFYAFIVILLGNIVREIQVKLERRAVLESTIAVIEARLGNALAGGSSSNDGIMNEALRKTYEPNSKFLYLEKISNKLNYTQVIVAAVGTIIWGYGDILVKCILTKI